MKITVLFSPLMTLGVLCFASSAVAANIVKQSTSGLCHPPQSSWYNRTLNYMPFETLQACLDAGGQLPAGVRLGGGRKLVDAPSVKQSQYRRSAFGYGWDDSDRDCQDSRAEALISASTTPVRFADDKRCRVVTGRWISPFTGEVIQNAANIEIDHVVPLAFAWERGAWEWSDEQREQFANDPVNLLPVEDSLNSSKQHRGPDEWLPPSGQCGYVARFVRVVKKYELSPTYGEQAWTTRFLEGCR
ncbi:HNH endonuclease family protein [Marinobacter nauticus]|uniref:HNH endonuclease family protein n=1 Tax=Marinobacter nauticus TaxID=2743 RepID=UPI00059FE60E|nr:HNH endonuclease family protein [Marinobacter nauticus]